MARSTFGDERARFPCSRLVGVIVAIVCLGLFARFHEPILSWLDARAWRYWCLALTGLGLLVFISWFCESPARWFPGWMRSRWLFAAMLLLVLFSFRWPTITYNRQLMDPDESQVLAGAITLTHDPVFWRSVDGTTHGPLDQYIFVIPHFLGLPIDYTTGRLVTVCLNALAIIAAWLGLSTFLPERMARLSVLPALFLYSFTSQEEDLQVGTEDLPAALVALALFLILKAWQNRQTNRSCVKSLFFAGVILGATPFAKLQGVPPALWLGIAALIAFSFVSGNRDGRGSNAAALVAGALLVPLVFGSILISTGVLGEFWEAYIINNIKYAQEKQQSSWYILSRFIKGESIGMFHRVYFLPIISVFCCGIATLPLLMRKHAVPVLIVVGYGLASLYAVVAPGREYFHYPRIFFVAASVTAGVLASLFYMHARERGKTLAAAIFVASFALLTLVPQFYFRLEHGGPFRGTYRAEHECKLSPTAVTILRYAGAGDALAHWGWEPKLYVQTQLRQATREAHTHHQIEPGPQQDYFRNRYMADLRKSNPRVFVDSVGDGNFAYTDRALQGHEIFPALRELIEKRYRLVGDYEGIRVYIRND